MSELNLPDGATGTVRNGHHGIDAITFWEEDGEIIEVMGPTIGLALAKFLETHPTHSHAEMIAHEIKRILLLSVQTEIKEEQ